MSDIVSSNSPQDNPLRKFSLPSTHKHCFICDQTKLRTEFHKSSSSPDGLLYQCKACRLKRISEYNKRTYDASKVRNRHLKKAYGITNEEYDAMFLAQFGVCAICGHGPGKDKKLVVDHCHKTHAVRGLLCDACNRMIGYAKDNQKALANAIKYLKRYGR